MSIVPQLIVNSLIAGSIYALIALGWNLIFSTTKFFNFVHGSYAAIGGYVVFYFVKSLNFPVWAAIILGVLVAAFAGLILDKLVYLPLRKKKSSNKIKLVSSIGMFTAIQAI